MSKFKLEKTFKLDFLGTGWEDAYLTFKALTVKDLRKVMEAIPTTPKGTEPKVVLKSVDNTIGLLKDCFIEGKALGEDGLIKVSKDDLEDFPIEVLMGVMDFLSSASAIPKSQQ